MNKHARQTKPFSWRRLGTWTAYGLAAFLFVGGQWILDENLGRGIAMIAAAFVLATLVYVVPALPWAAWVEAWRREQQKRPAAPAGRPAKGVKAFGPALRALGNLAWVRTLGDGLGGVIARRFPEDRLELGRWWLLVPAGGLLLASLAQLNRASVVGALISLTGASLLIWVYLQAMQRPLVVPKLRQNLLSLFGLFLVLPVQLVAVYLMHVRFEKPSFVWLGAFLCAGASAAMIVWLKRHPLDLELAELPEGAWAWTPPKPFFNSARFSFISSLLAGAALAAYLAKNVFPAEHPGWSVSMGFLAIILLLGSFPWMPEGLVWFRAFSPMQRLLVALGGSGAAFFLGRQGQVLMERGNITGGLWAFLAGGVVLILCFSRFQPVESALTVPATPSTSPTPAASKAQRPVVEIAAVLLLLALSFSFRIWKIGVFPYGVEGDEGGGGVWAVDALLGRVEHPLIHQNYPLAFFSVTALFFKLAGVGLASLRWHAVLFGTLSIASTYFFLRLLLGRWAAFTATLLMSFSYWHLHYSRFGHYNIEQVAVQMMAFYFAFKAMRTGSLWQWAAGGAAFGLAMLPHLASRLLPFQGIALLLFFFVGRRELLRRYLPGFLAFVMGAWAVAGPMVVYWNRARTISLGRAQSVSIFDKNNTNAPVDTLDGFVRNCKVSMLMFNYQGDTRLRDNPVAPDKILEHWTAVLFALAFVYALYHWRDPATFFLLAAFFINLAASVFSVEAPQTLRSAGNIPIVFALIALPLARLREALLQVGRLRGTLLFAVLVLPAAIFFSYRSAVRYFVDARRMQFDTAATYVAQKAGQEGGPDTQAVFWGTGFASSHPPMILLTQQTPLRNFYGPFEYLPINKAVERDHLLFLVDDYQEILPYVRSLYPSAKVEPLPDLVNGGNLAQYIRVDKDQLRATLGLDGEATLGGRTVTVSGVEPRLPSPALPGASRVKLHGSIHLDRFGRYRFGVTGKGAARLSIDGHVAFSRAGGMQQSPELLLARGLHSVSLQMEPAGPEDAMAVHYSVVQPHAFYGNWVQRGRSEFIAGLADFLRFEPSGFYAEYFTARVPEGDPLVEIIEPVVLNHWLDSPIVGTWTARWRTRFKVDQEGDYRFSQRGGALFATVRVDGQLVYRQGVDPRGEMVPMAAQPFIRLKPGWHDYEAVFTTSGPPGNQLRWSPPGQADQVFWQAGLKPLNVKMPR